MTYANLPVSVLSCGLTASDTSAMKPPAETLTKNRSFSTPTSVSTVAPARQHRDGLFHVFRQAQRAREVVPRAERDEAERDPAERALDRRDAVQHLVQSPVAARDEQALVAFARRALGQPRRVAALDRHHDVHVAERGAQTLVQERQQVRCRVRAGDGVDDEPGFHRIK